MSIVFYCEEFNECDLDNGKTPLRKKFNEIIKDLEENNSTSQGNIKLIKGDGNIEYFRAKLSDSDRLLFTRRKHNDKDAFVILEVILNHDYHKSKFLTNREKIRNIKIIGEEVPDTVEIEDAPQVSYLGKFITFSAKQEDIVERIELPLVINGAAGSGKTSVALESLKRIKEKFEEGKVLYITQSENLIKQSKELFEYEYYDEIAGEFKIGIPERIEFLSLHEFLEKKAEDIKGKKPIDRNKFFSWFDEICKKDKFKEYKKDGDKIFEEFTAVIGGKGLLGENGKDLYEKLGKRESMFPENERSNIYDFFKEYRKFIEKDSEYYDPNLVTHQCITEGMYDAIVVDEVQDLTESTLDLVLKSLKDENKSNFLLCGDVNQVIHPSFFSLSKLKSFLCQNRYIMSQGSGVFYTLERNYRNSEQVIEFANRILHLKNYCFASEDKITVDNAFFMKSETKKKGNVGFITDDKKEEIAKQVNESINCAVLVLNDESKKSARQLFDTPLVFNIHEAKGLEFENVILYKFTSCKAYNEIWKIACTDKSDGEIDNTINRIRDSYNEKEVNTSRNKDKKDKSLEKYKFYMNALYVGVTRAASNVYIIDDKSNLLKIIEPEEEDNVNIEQEKSSPEEWKKKALELIEKGNIEQAERIATKLQKEGKREYAEEVTNALKANRDHEKDQALDKNKRANSVLESDISSRSSQSSEHEGDDISKPQSKESRHNKNKKKKAKKRHQVQEVEPQLSLEDSTSQSKKPQNVRHNQDLNDEKESKRLEKNTKELFLALRNKNPKKAKRLIEQGVNVHARDKIGSTALHWAAENGYYEVVHSLLSNGAEINVKIDREDFTPLNAAVVGGHYDIVALFLEKGADIHTKATGKYAGYTSLHFAAEKNHLDIVKLLLDYRADVNAKDDSGKTPLHNAAENGHLEIVKYLIEEKNVDVNAKTKVDDTPLHLAVKKGLYDIVKFLLKNGAEVDAKDQTKTTPLHWAAAIGCKSIVEFLLAYGAEINAKISQQGYTPLNAAVMGGHYGIVALFLEKGADIHTKATGKYAGYTSLHFAAEKNHLDIVKLLLDYRADVNAKTDEGNTPLSLALENSYSKIIDLLLADPNINVGCIDLKSVKNEGDKRKCVIKRVQDGKLFNKVKEAANEKDTRKLDKLLKEIKELLESKNKHGFKPSLNYSPDGNDENTTIEIAINAGGKLLHLLYDYAEKNIDKNTKIFKKLKRAKENSQSKGDLCDVSVLKHSTPDQGFVFREC
ncbi:ankyrin repeat domain-containing protein [Wolbachia endosymbiont (group B) of Episyrphus balteatus]|uniref:ankyrin repeat domain-containing protein n=1 Tax=Wolbachia endosymbiont (group B) of Episyrphus balteatus TaxID=2954009 RepID=UPI002226EE16|nr:ankyrin repeat domain-containing protein [Wolbachia endosymbiont (group B) of Episyrphus balteatus]